MMSEFLHITANDDNRAELRHYYGETLKLYKKHFGDPDSRIWTDMVTTCGDSYSGAMPMKKDSWAKPDPFQGDEDYHAKSDASSP
ncbi:MAG: hypothetical protein OXT67_10070 [Zetaproteobacteria bacterium]|nr:hypothetical protein [Zetaproteobacteria bacterium]